MTLGRPMTISREDASAVPMPLPIDDIHISSTVGVNGDQPQYMLSQIGFYVHSLQLYLITEKVLSAFYSRPEVSTPQPKSTALDELTTLDFNMVIQLSTLLQTWHDSLPRELIVRHDILDEALEPVFSRQANVLRLRSEHSTHSRADASRWYCSHFSRYLQINILLFRPIFSAVLVPAIRAHAVAPNDTAPSLPLLMALPCVRNCVRSALEVIDLTYSRQVWDGGSKVESLPAWWYEVFCRSCRINTTSRILCD